jgi:ornithine decarboxylase
MDKKKQEINKQLKNELHDTAILDVQGLVSMFNEERIQSYDTTEYKIVDIIQNLIQQRSSLTSFLIIDIGAIFRQYKLWKSLLPNVEIYYAVKCNPDIIMLTTLAYLGVNFDVASKTEIHIVDSLGIPTKMIFANPVKEIDHIMYARSLNINLMTFDNEDELKKISVFHPKAELVLRLLVDDSKSKMPFGSKFGCPASNLDNLFVLAKQLKVNIVGVSFHVGSGCTDTIAYKDAIKYSRTVFDKATEYGYNFNILDIGGGFPGSNETSSEVKFEEIALEINNQLKESFTDIEGLRVLAEPGRFFATSCGTLVTNIIGKKLIMKDEPVYHYYINSSLYGIFNNVLFDHAHPHFHLLSKYTKPKYKSTIFGQTCDSMDKICEAIDLPELACGDWLYVPNHGAYTVSAGSTFNGFSLAEIKYIYTFN